MKSLLSSQLKRCCPGTWHALRERLVASERAKRPLKQAGGWMVHHGPFSGLKIPREIASNLPAPMIIGSYEQELHPTLERIIQLTPRNILQLGAAEGWLAAGLAMRLPDCRIVAYEAHAGQRARAAHWSMSTIRWEGAFTPEHAASLDPAPAVLICDVEGQEAELFTDDSPRRLNRTHLLIETHDYYRPGITDRLAETFSDTHHITRIEEQPRDPGAYPCLRKLSKDRAAALLNEHRATTPDQPQAWLWMEPHNSEGTGS